MQRLITVIFSLFLVANVFAENLGSANMQLIETAGIKIHPDADFVNGSQDVGFRFATARPQDEVRAWYRKQLPKWSLYEEFGGWILYEGKPGADIGDLMDKKQVSVKENKMMQEWFDIDPVMTTEIVIMIPRQ